MTIYVKICGISNLETALAAVEAGADAVGFVFADSVRQIEPSRAAAIAAELPGRIDRFAVFLRPSPAEVSRVLSIFPADVVQADHGSVPELEGSRALPVFREGDAAALEDYLDRTVSRRFHYEGRLSGAGQAVDWVGAAKLARRGRMTLAGGLHPANVAEAIRQVQPFGVDVSSGVESAPGLKDPVKIRDFIETVRQTEKETVNR